MSEYDKHFSLGALFKMAFPSIIMMIFSSIYGVVDGLFISNVEGNTAFSAINFIMPYLMLLGVFGFMFGSGGAALVSKTFGEKDDKRANRYFTMLMIVLFILGIVATIFGFFTVKPMASLLGADAEMLPYCEVYGHAMMFFVLFFMFQNAFQSFMVVARKPMLGFFFTFCAGVTNILGDFLLVYVFRYGVFGAAIATGLSQIIGSLLPFLYLVLFPHKTPLHFEKTRLEFKPIIKAMSNGLSEMVSNVSMSLVNMLFNAQLMKFIGQNGVSAFGIIMYASFVFVGVYFGYSVGVSSVISYHYGAQNCEELGSLLRKCLLTYCIFSVILSTSAILLAKPIALIFVRENPELVALSERAIRFYSISFYFSGFNIFASSFFTDLNDGFVSGVISFARTFFFQVIAILVFPVLFGPDSLWFAVLFAELCSLGLSVAFLFAKEKKYHYFA